MLQEKPSASTEALEPKRPRRKTGADPVPCSSCRILATHPRRGLCQRCYMRAYTGRELANGCGVCGLRDTRLLTRKTLADGVATLCGSHAMLAGRRTLSLPELVAEAFPAGDRRRTDRRNEDRRTPTGRRLITKVGWLSESNRRDGGRRTADAKTALGCRAVSPATIHGKH